MAVVHNIFTMNNAGDSLYIYCFVHNQGWSERPLGPRAVKVTSPLATTIARIWVNI